jgi:hypothetical protein
MRLEDTLNANGLDVEDDRISSSAMQAENGRFEAVRMPIAYGFFFGEHFGVRKRRFDGA